MKTANNSSNGLALARQRLAEIHAAGGKVERLDPIAKATANPGSLRLAITAMCWNCAGAGADGMEFTRQNIRECQVKRCPLYPHRPYQKPTRGGE